MKTADLCQLAADLATEHGACALEFTRLATVSLELDGHTERAHFWELIGVLVDDIVAQRFDPDLPLVIH